jgi:GNAT superfamily N-acetyltransferase
VAGLETTADDRGTPLRRATATDVPRLTEFVWSAYGHYVDRIGRRPRPMTDDYADVIRIHQAIVALRSGEIIGVIVLRIDADGFLVDNVAVDPAHHGTGVGKLLLEFAEAAAREAGFDSIYLYTHERMTENLTLYSHIGYVEDDRRRVGAAPHVPAQDREVTSGVCASLRGPARRPRFASRAELAERRTDHADQARWK